LLSRYVLHRLIQAIPTIVGVILIVFFMVRVLPGDPATVIAGMEATTEEVERIRHELGLDQPLFIQLITYVLRLLQGDLGISARTGAPVLTEILARLPNTITLAIVAQVLSTFIGIVAGIAAALKPYSIRSHFVTCVSLIGVSIPVFWLGLMLILIFSVNLQWLPAGGAGTPAHMVLPALSLALLFSGNIMRVTRSSMLEVLGQSYVRTARSKGLHERVVIYRHALKNALIPIVTISGVQFGMLLSGAVLVETVFAWPGMGRLLVDSILARDYPMVQGCVLIFGLLFIFVNIMVDIIYAYIDPRVRELLWMGRLQ
jgi:peptide/nickel transport system permease protein/oligopeptide transport system permease protein